MISPAPNNKPFSLLNDLGEEDAIIIHDLQRSKMRIEINNWQRLLRSSGLEPMLWKNTTKRALVLKLQRRPDGNHHFRS